MKRAFALLAVLVAAAGCARGAAADGVAATEPRPAPSPENLVPDDYKGRFEVRATVLENQNHGPQLCTGVADSLPPQCSGPDIAGWKWPSGTYESAVQSKWGLYVLTGTFDGKTFTLTQPPQPPTADPVVPRSGPDFTSPCPVPAGGWKATDPAKATSEAMEQVNELVQHEPDYGGLWIDEPAAALDPTPHNDPRRLVLNVTFTKDLDKHRAQIRKIWGGALCVSPARHSDAELRRIQDEIVQAGDVNGAGADGTTGTVTVDVLVAREGRQRELDAKYGAGTVILHGFMKRLD
jgi:hypothetical protein